VSDANVTLLVAMNGNQDVCDRTWEKGPYHADQK